MDEAIEIFDNYYNNYDNNQSSVKKKYDHTFRVVDYAEQIARSLDLSYEDIDLAKKCALFHDIARFKQWTEYNTFNDSKSFDHGDIGYNILKELNINDETILLSTKYHNKYEVDKLLDERTKMFCNITRDADKIDILLRQNRKCRDLEYSINEDVYNCIKGHRLVNNELVDEDGDIFDILRSVAFIFDINYKKSFEIIKESNEINYKFDLILNKFNNQKIKELKDICNKYIDERIDKNVRY